MCWHVVCVIRFTWTRSSWLNAQGFEVANSLHHQPTDETRALCADISFLTSMITTFVFVFLMLSERLLLRHHSPSCSISRLYADSSKCYLANKSGVLGKYKDGIETILTHTVEGVKKIEKGARHAALWSTYGDVVHNAHWLRSADEDVKHPVCLLGKPHKVSFHRYSFTLTATGLRMINRFICSEVANVGADNNSIDGTGRSMRL